MNLPSQSQMLLPLLEAIHDAGGIARPGELYDEVAKRMGLADEVRNLTVERPDRGKVNLFERRVRWTRQTAIMKGLITTEQRGVWALTERANAKLHNIVRGAIVTLFETKNGIFLWANAEDALGVIERGSIELLLSSPPYPLVKGKEYGNLNHTEWVDWMLRLCEQWRDLLTPSGSMVLNLGCCWIPGMPAQSLYIERLLVRLEDQLGIHLCQRLDWFSPTKLPPLNWVGIRRVRVTPSVEPLLWLSTTPDKAKGNNRHVLRPYSKSGLRSIHGDRSELVPRPCGIQFGETSFQDCGGSIPSSLISATPTSIEEHRYRRAVRAAGRKAHPAIMPAAVARFVILLATDENDVVYDPMAGSGTSVIEAIKLGRYGIASERSREYLESAFIRSQAEDLEPVWSAA